MKTKETKDRCRSSVGIVDKSLSNLYHVHSDLVKTNATLRDRAAINMAAWKGDIFGAGRRCK